MVISLNGTRYEYPGCWEELKTRQYQRIIKEWDQDKPLAERDFFKLFSILTDTSYGTYHPTSENEVTIWNSIRWFIEQDFKFSESVPKVLLVEGEILDIPPKPQLLSIGQNMHLRQEIEKAKYLDECLSIAVAIYLQPVYDKEKFDFERAKELEKVIADMPVYLIRPIGFFLLASALNYGKTQGLSWQQMRTNLTRMLNRMYQSWQRFRGSSHSMIYH